MQWLRYLLLAYVYLNQYTKHTKSRKTNSQKTAKYGDTRMVFIINDYVINT